MFARRLFNCPNDLKDNKRLKFLQIAVCIGFIGGVLLSHELWFAWARTFPRVSMFFEVPVLIDRLLTVILIISLILINFFERLKIFSISAIASLILLIVFDQLRLQPWVYQYLLLLILLALQSENDSNSNQTLGLSQIIIAGLYFWSGVQKLNFTFSHETLSLLLAPLQNTFPSFQPPLVLIGVSIAIFESLIGCGLIFRKTRNLAVCLAVLMHATILAVLIAKDYNRIIWIWNAILMLIVIIVFWKNDGSIKQTITFSKVINWKVWSAKSIAFASVLLPILSFVGWSDMYLSGALYSGNTAVGVIRINEDLYGKLPPKAQQNVFQTKSSGEKMLPLSEWSMSEFNVPAYPEKRIFKQVAREVCKLTNDRNNIELIIKERPEILDGIYKVTRISCEQLEQ